jgi:hypothetical protein
MTSGALAMMTAFFLMPPTSVAESGQMPWALKASTAWRAAS